MKIAGFQKLTLLNYPEKVAATIFTGGCNLRCPFCQNVDLVYNVDKIDNIENKKIFEYLKERKNQLEGVCITGGEPLLNDDIDEFLYEIKNIGLSIKIDTNGYFPKNLDKIINKKLVDMVAMDIKSGFSNYDFVSGIKKGSYYIGNINDDIHNMYKKHIEENKPKWIESINIIMNSDINYEFRTTCVKNIHNRYDFYEIREMIKNAKKYYLQNYHSNEQIKNLPYESFTNEELALFMKIVEPMVDFIKIRES